MLSKTVGKRDFWVPSFLPGRGADNLKAHVLDTVVVLYNTARDL
jgi:hypothetical protein